MTDHMTDKRADGGFGGQRIPKVKVCGIRTIQEADWLNAAGVDYAGFVLCGKSRRSVSMMDAIMIKKSLYPSVKSVAVTVSPTVEELRQIEIGGFDIIQVHNDLPLEVLRECKLPIWRAFNIGSSADPAGAEAGCEQVNDTGANGRLREAAEDEANEEERGRLEDALIEAYVLDGAVSGGGKTFDWADGSLVERLRALFGEKKLVLAGGLNTENVAEGIRIFAPDIVDVSSGVERDYGSGKDEEKIYQFVRKVREG